MTVDAIMERRENAKNPARRPNITRREELEAQEPPIDSEFIGRVHAVTEVDKWTVVKVPVGSEGDIVKTTFTSTDTMSHFVVAFFGAAVKPNELSQYVPNPFVMVDDAPPFLPKDPDSAVKAWLEDREIIDVLGGPGERAGYWPGKESAEDPLTGLQRDTTINIHYASVRPPFLWLAFYTGGTASKIEGRIFTAPSE
jgi:hypothetical protein